MKRLWFLLITAFVWLVPLQMVAVGGGSATVSISATILSKNKCQFNTKNPTLDFGLLDPSNPVVRNAKVTIAITCNGSAPLASYAMSEDGGLDSYKMTHGTDTTQKIPYTLTLSPATGSGLVKGNPYDVDIDGSIQGADYQTVAVGVYSDTVTLTLLP